MTPDDLLVVVEDGSIVCGEGRLERSAFVIHSALHKGCDRDVVFHTHQPAATARKLFATSCASIAVAASISIQPSCNA